MVDTTTAPRFDALRKEAKRWLKALRSGDRNALQRLAKLMPHLATPPGLRVVQQALARERGFESWAALKEQLQMAAIEERGRFALRDDFLERACIFSGPLRDFPEKWRRAERIRVRHPGIATLSIHTAVVCGELEHVAQLLGQEPGLVAQKGGPQAWEPLLFVCYGRLPNRAAADRSLAIAELLLDAGADPNSAFVTPDEWRLRFTALTGVMGAGEMGQPEHPRGAELARLLLERGADPNDSQGLYNTHLVGDDPRWLELLFSFGLGPRAMMPAAPGGEPEPILDYLVAQAAARGHLERLRCLLEHGASPNAHNRYNSQSSFGSALMAGRRDVAAVLAEHGATPERLAGHAAFVAACNLGEHDQAAQLVHEHPEYKAVADPLIDAAERGDIAAVERFLDLGVDPNRPGRHGHRALHSACERRQVVELLLARGADPRARVFGGTAAGWAKHAGDTATAQLIAAKSRSLLDAVATGHLALATELLAADPGCVNERSPRGESALHLLPAEAECTEALIELLLAHGADPKSKNEAGQTPAEQLESIGLDQLADQLSAAY